MPEMVKMENNYGKGTFYCDLMGFLFRPPPSLFSKLFLSPLPSPQGYSRTEQQNALESLY